MSSDRAIASLLSGLASGDAQAADASGRALLAQGPSVLPRLLSDFAATPAAARRRLAFLFGKFDAKGSIAERRREVLHAALNDDDWKVRRNAAMSLGALDDQTSSDALLARLAVEDDPAVRPSLMLAVGRVATADQLPRLRLLATQSDKEREAAAKMIDSVMGRSGIGSRVLGQMVPAPEAAVELWSRAGVAELVASEAQSLGIDAIVVTPDRVRIPKPVPLTDLLKVRSSLFPALVFESGVSFEEPASLGREFCGSPVASAIRSLTDGDPTYRLSLEARSSKWSRRSDWIREFAAACPTLENKATSYAWDVVVRVNDTGTLLAARPAAIEDSRFAYRLSDVPASIHPTLAAAAVRLIPWSDHDVVVDPFCGSGTLLAERAVFGPYETLNGIDDNPRAIEAARQNLQGLSSVTLRCADFTTLRQVRSPSVIFTNPPYGKRVSGERQARELHRRLDSLASTALVPGGHLVVFRPVGFPSPRDLRVLSQRRVDAGGIAVNLIVAQRPTSGR